MRSKEHPCTAGIYIRTVTSYGTYRLVRSPDCRRRQRHFLQRQFARSLSHGCCPVAVSDASANPRLRDAVVPLPFCETLPLRAFVRFPAPLFFFGVLPGFLLFPLSTPFFIFCLMVILRLSPLFIFPLETSPVLSFPSVFFLSRPSLLPLESGSRISLRLPPFFRLRCAPSSLSAARVLFLSLFPLQARSRISGRIGLCLCFRRTPAQ